MADIVIRGMEMPQAGDKIELVQNIAGHIYARFEPSKGYMCEVVPLPEKHGRLIDADKMRESIRRQTGLLKFMGGELAEIAETIEKGFLQEIDSAPTIVPAEGENTDG